MGINVGTDKPHAQRANNSRSRSAVRLLYWLSSVFDGEGYPEGQAKRRHLADRGGFAEAVSQDGQKTRAETEATKKCLNYIRISYMILAPTEGG